jgi:hypothetical protein
MGTPTEMDVLREVARTVLGKAKHDAPGFEHLVLTLTGAVAAYHAPASVRTGTREGHHVSSCWFDLDTVTYFLSYDHGFGRIRSGGKQGHVDFECSETTTEQDVLAWFESKSPVPVIN